MVDAKCIAKQTFTKIARQNSRVTWRIADQTLETRRLVADATASMTASQHFNTRSLQHRNRRVSCARCVGFHRLTFFLAAHSFDVHTLANAACLVCRSKLRLVFLGFATRVARYYFQWFFDLFVTETTMWRIFVLSTKRE
jgi:hypothetical protein